MTQKKKAFITGITGQDGSYLAELLLSKGYEVHAILRRSSVFTTQRIEHIFENENLFTYYGDNTDSSNLNALISKVKPDEFYNLAAQSHVAVSFEVPEYTADVTGVSTIRILDALRQHCPKCKFYQASTSELFGGLPDTAPQSESTPFHPKSPYGVAKLYSYWITVNYRESYGLFAVNGILFNHESPRRGATFVTKKISRAVASILKGDRECLELGNLNAKRDWGHAKDYVYAMWLMLQNDSPVDLVVATGRTYTVRQFCEEAFKCAGINIEWSGTGLNEIGRCSNSRKVLIKVNEKYFRPAEVELLHGDATKIMNLLGWRPRYSFTDLVQEMVHSDLTELGVNPNV